MNHWISPKGVRSKLPALEPKENLPAYLPEYQAVYWAAWFAEAQEDRTWRVLKSATGFEYRIQYSRDELAGDVPAYWHNWGTPILLSDVERCGMEVAVLSAAEFEERRYRPGRDVVSAPTGKTREQARDQLVKMAVERGELLGFWHSPGQPVEPGTKASPWKLNAVESRPTVTFCADGYDFEYAELQPLVKAARAADLLEFEDSKVIDVTGCHSSAPGSGPDIHRWDPFAGDTEPLDEPGESPPPPKIEAPCPWCGGTGKVKDDRGKDAPCTCTWKKDPPERLGLEGLRDLALRVQADLAPKHVTMRDGSVRLANEPEELGEETGPFREAGILSGVASLGEEWVVGKSVMEDCVITVPPPHITGGMGYWVKVNGVSAKITSVSADGRTVRVERS